MKAASKILHVVPELGYGGVERVVQNYYQQINHSKYVFDFVTHGNVENYHQEILEQGSEIYYLKTVGMMGLHGYKKQIKEQIDLQQYDIVHIHTGHVVGLYAYLYKCCGAKKVICHAHVTACSNSKQKCLMPLFRCMATLVSDELIACGRDAGRYCFGKSNFYLLPNGLRFETYNKVNQEDIRRIKKSFGIDKGTFVIGHVGRFSKEKNHSFLAKIIHDYVKNNKNVKFILVGDGPDRETIENIIQANGDQEYVIFTGIRNDVNVLMKLFDVFLLPSLSEGLPVVGIEAQAAGTPCLFSKTIDKAVCIYKDSCEFIPINKGTKVWIEAINRSRNCSRNSTVNIYNALCENGYEISSAVCKLEAIYGSLISTDSK